MTKSTCIQFENQHLFHCFTSIRDPRVKARCTYPLINILVMVVCAMICGHDTWEGIVSFSKSKKRWLGTIIDMRNGVPSSLTFARVFDLIEPDQFKQCLSKWVAQFFDLVKYDIINLDGKTLRGSARKSHQQKGTHIVNAYLAKEAVTLAEERVDDKSNEIKAIPKLLKQLTIKDCIITIDAMGCQKGIAKLIREKKADYVLALKKNHKRFYRNVESTFDQSDKLDYENMQSHQHTVTDHGHGRHEERTYTILPSTYFLKHKSIWRDLGSVIRVESKRELFDRTETGVRYYISSLKFKEYNRACQAIRQHWSVENNLHWKLDVGMHEDQCRVSRGNADQNLATLRKMVLKMLEDESTFKHGIAMKRLHALESSKYLRKVVGF